MNDQTKLQRKKKTQRSISRNIITKYIVFEEKKFKEKKLLMTTIVKDLTVYKKSTYSKTVIMFKPKIKIRSPRIINKQFKSKKGKV